MAKITPIGLPNISNPKYKTCTVKRIRKALGWAAGCLNDEPREVSKAWLNSVFGQQQNALSAWLRSKLLICTNHKYYFGSGFESKCKEYVLNRTGYQEVKGVLNGAAPTSNIPVQSDNIPAPVTTYDLEVVYSWVQESYASELKDMNFVYDEKDNGCPRLWHQLQNLRSIAKAHVWPKLGLMFDYDIKACAPTLILRHAQNLGLDEYMFGIEDFLKDTKGFRDHIAELVDIPYKNAKALINALFCGARLGANNHYALFRLLGCDKNKIKILARDKRLQDLRKNIKACWSTIEPTLCVYKNEIGRKLPLNSKRKWNVYFELERAVLNVVRSYLKDHNVKCFLEHDGWRTDKAIDVLAVQDEVFAVLGLRIQIS